MASLDSLVRRFKSRPLVCIVALNLALLCSGNWILPIIDRDEPRFAEASREMISQHDWVIPRFNGQPRYDKPPLIYWLQAASFTVLGESEFAARLPSCLFTTAIAVMLYFWGRREGHPDVGIMASVIFTTCLEVLAYGRLAFADMPMIFFFALAVWSGWEASSRKGSREIKWWLIFGASLGLGFLAKGPVAWLPLAGLVAIRLFRPAEIAIPGLKLLLGLALTLAIISAWGIPSLIATHGEFLYKGLGHHVIGRSIYVFEGHGGRGLTGWFMSFPFFFLIFFIGFAPWSFWVLGCARGNGKSSSPDSLGFYLKLQAFIVFIVFTLVHTKLPHYTLPAFPCLALWLARRLAKDNSMQTKVFSRGTVMAVLSILATTIGFTLIKPVFASHALFEKVRPSLSRDMRLAFIEYDEPAIVWESRSVLTNYSLGLSREGASNFLAQPGPKILILPTQICLAYPSLVPTNASVFQSSGLDMAHGRHVDLTAIVAH